MPPCMVSPTDRIRIKCNESIDVAHSLMLIINNVININFIHNLHTKIKNVK